MGTLQRFEHKEDCLTIVASRGFSSDALRHFAKVRRETNSSCAAALILRRMRVFVEEVSTSYLYVGTRKLGVAAVQSTPIIGSDGWFRGVFSTHFHAPKSMSSFGRMPLNQLAMRMASCMEALEDLAPSDLLPSWEMLR
jgi:hypothetical protein